MSYYFNTNFLDRLQAGTSFSTSIVVYLFENAPAFDSSEPQITTMLSPPYAGIDTPAGLVNELGWGPYIKGPALTTVQSTVGTDFRFVELVAPNQLFNLAADFPTTRVRALVFCENVGTPGTDQIIFATNTPLFGGTVVNNWDSLMAQFDTGTAANVLFSWTQVDAPTPQTAREGAVLILRGAPPFESARTQHVWIYPQRLNLICNPSFEGLPLTSYWRSNGTLAQTTPAPPGSGVNAGRVSGTSPLVLESNYFPLNYGRRRETGWTVQLQARCHGDFAGKLKVAMLTWEEDFVQTYTDWGSEEWIISGGFTQVRTLRNASEAYMGQLRIEVVDCPYFDIDQVCVEPGLLPTNGYDWPYFDGASLYDNEGDYAWYGGDGRANATYSCWYNFRYPTFGRLFAKLVDTSEPSGAVFTELDEARQGAVYQWVPAGTEVQSWLDVLYPGDPRTQPAPLTGTVHPYKDLLFPTTTPLGIVPPTWG